MNMPAVSPIQCHVANDIRPNNGTQEDTAVDHGLPSDQEHNTCVGDRQRNHRKNCDGQNDS